MKDTALPEAAADKLAALDLERQKCEDEARSLTNRINNLPADATKLAERMQRERAKANYKHDELHALTSGIRQWITRLPNSTRLEMAPMPEPRLIDGETVTQAITRTRTEISTTDAHLRTIKSAPLPKADQKKLVHKYVEQLQTAGRPRVSIDHRGVRVDFLDPQRADPALAFRDSINVMAWLRPADFVTALESEIDMMPDPVLAMTAEEREKRTSELSARLDVLERQEESLIEAALAQGVVVARREEASPLAVLNVRIVARVQAAA
jgi:hypothetical protein